MLGRVRIRGDALWRCGLGLGVRFRETRRIVVSDGGDTAMQVAGVDGCKGGWVTVLLDDSGFQLAVRHSAAKLRRDAGETIESVSSFLDHSSLAVTTTYLRRMEGVEDRSWDRVAEAIGVGV